MGKKQDEDPVTAVLRASEEGEAKADVTRVEEEDAKDAATAVLETAEEGETKANMMRLSEPTRNEKETKDAASAALVASMGEGVPLLTQGSRDRLKGCRRACTLM